MVVCRKMIQPQIIKEEGIFPWVGPVGVEIHFRTVRKQEKTISKRGRANGMTMQNAPRGKKIIEKIGASRKLTKIV